MSNERKETIADIVAEMRIGDLCSSDTAERSMYINDFLASYADRIEAAHKREREAGAEEAQICGEIGEMIGREASKNQSVTNCNRLGNVAKMREALKRADAVLSLISKSAWFIDANFAVTKAVIEAGNAIEADLSAPPRNCDRPECATTKEAQEVWRKEDGGKTAYYEWLLETSTKGEENENS